MSHKPPHPPGKATFDPVLWQAEGFESATMCTVALRLVPFLSVRALYTIAFIERVTAGFMIAIQLASSIAAE